MRDPVIALDPNLQHSNVLEAPRTLWQWVVWQYVERNGKQTKCPIRPTRRSLSAATCGYWVITVSYAVTAAWQKTLIGCSMGSRSIW